jgi:hypothetical protein
MVVSALVPPDQAQLIEVTVDEVLDRCDAIGAESPVELVAAWRSSEGGSNLPRGETGRSAGTTDPSKGGSLDAPSAAPGRKRLKRGEAAMKIVAAIESFAEHRQWNAPENEIIKRAGVPRATYYRCSKDDPRVQRTMDAYHARRLGRGPVKPGEF